MKFCREFCLHSFAEITTFLVLHFPNEKNVIPKADILD